MELGAVMANEGPGSTLVPLLIVAILDKYEAIFNWEISQFMHNIQFYY